jgi:hypothetical protein
LQANRCFADAQYRFNDRFNLGSILIRLIRAASRTIPTLSSSSFRAAEENR